MSDQQITPNVLRFSGTYRLSGVLSILLGGVFTFLWSLQDRSPDIWYWIILLIYFSLIPLGIHLIFKYYRKIEVDAFGMNQFSLFGGKAYLSWMDIHHAQGKGERLILRDKMGDNKIILDPAMIGFEGLLEQIRQKRPDLWLLRGTTEFHQTLVRRLLIIGGWLILTLYFGYQYYHTGDMLWLIFTAMTFAGGGYLIIKEPQKVTIDGDQLRVRYLLREVMVRSENIQDISVVVVRTRGMEALFANGSSQASAYVRVSVKDGKKIDLRGLNIGPAELGLKLRSWWEDQVKVEKLPLNNNPGM